MKDRVRRKEPGAVMVFALVLMTAGVFVLAAVLQLAATQGISGDAEWAAVQRRVTLGNSRAMAREYMHSRIFRGPVPADINAGSVTFTNGLGGFSIQPAGSMQTNYWAALSTTNTDVVLNINPFNLMERGGFYREVFVGQLQEGGGTTAWSFALRTRSPVAAGYSFVQHRPADNNVASLAAPPYIDMNSASGEQFFGFYGLPRMPIASVTNTMTRGSGDTNGYQGYLDVQEGASAAGFFTNAVYELRPGTTDQAQVVLDLAATDPNIDTAVLRYDDNNDVATNILVGTNTSDLPVTTMVLKGSMAFGQKPLHIVVPSARTNLGLLVLSNNNDRLVYFNRIKDADDGRILSVSARGAARWRIGFTMIQCRLRFGLSGVIVTGGLRADSSVTFPSGAVEIRPESDPGGLDFIADRMMWLEDYRAQQ
jgi:hypothetical protein